jgi:hypothetical protein
MLNHAMRCDIAYHLHSQPLNAIFRYSNRFPFLTSSAIGLVLMTPSFMLCLDHDRIAAHPVLILIYDIPAVQTIV